MSLPMRSRPRPRLGARLPVLILAGLALGLAGLGAGDLDGGDLASLPLVSPPTQPGPPPRTADFKDRAFVLCWHTFLGVPSLPTDFSPEELGAQLDSLAALGYRFVDLEDLMAGRIEGHLNLVATIDDGHRSVPLGVEKVFVPRGIRPALFVYPAIIGSIPSAMDDGALRRLQALGCAIGAHGYHHLYVTEDLYKSDRTEFNKEIYKAKDKTEALSKASVLMYAYPYGAYSPVTVSEVAKAGYAWGFAVKKGFVYREPGLNMPYELPRVVVTRENWKEVYDFLRRGASSPAP